MKTIADLQQMIADVEARSSDLHACAFERIDSLDRLTQELYRMLKSEQPARTRRSTYNHWTDAPRLIRS